MLILDKRLEKTIQVTELKQALVHLKLYIRDQFETQGANDLDCINIEAISEPFGVNLNTNRYNVFTITDHYDAIIMKSLSKQQIITYIKHYAQRLLNRE